jgi:DNA-binding MarR family transcriptional regulator
VSTNHSPLRQAVLEGLRSFSAASDLLDLAVAEQVGVNRTDLRCLDHLARFGPLPAGRLAEAVGLTSGAFTAAIDRLVKAGFVRRRADPADRRRVLVELTADADRVVALFADLRGATNRLLADFSDAELQLLGQFLENAAQTLSDHAKAILNRTATSAAWVPDRG